MSTTINGVVFSEDVVSYDIDDVFELDMEAIGTKYPRTKRGPRKSLGISFVLPVITTTPQTDITLLRGLLAENTVVLVEASDQTIIDNVKRAYVKIERANYRHQPGAPSKIEASVTGEIVGIPVGEGGMALKALVLAEGLRPTEWDRAYFPLTDGGRKGVVPLTTLGRVEWDPRDTNDWTDTRGSWRVKRGKDRRWVVLEDTGSVGDYLTIWEGITTLTNGVVQARIRPEGSIAGLAYRMGGAATTSTGYVARIDPTAGEVRLEDRTGDDTYSTLGTHSTTFVKGRWYHLAISGDSSRVRVFLDGDLVLDVATTTYTTGRAGLVTDTDDGRPEWDEILITDSQSPRVSVVAFHQDASDTIVSEEVDVKVSMGADKTPAVKVPQTKVVTFSEDLS